MKNMSFGREVFREPQNSGSVDIVLDKYARAINKPNSTGALLFSVVGKFFNTLFYFKSVETLLWQKNCWQIYLL